MTTAFISVYITIVIAGFILATLILFFILKLSFKQNNKLDEENEKLKLKLIKEDKEKNIEIVEYLDSIIIMRPKEFDSVEEFDEFFDKVNSSLSFTNRKIIILTGNGKEDLPKLYLPKV